MTELDVTKVNRQNREGFNGFCGVLIDRAAGGESRVHVDLEPRHFNPWGSAHGGLLSTLMDVAAGAAAISACDPPRRMVTQSAEIHYLRPAAGTRLTAEARTLKAGRSVAFVQVEAKDDAGALVAAGSFELFYLPEDRA